jgi:hypothetical protein
MTHTPSWPGLSRPSTSLLCLKKEGVDARDKPGHDEANVDGVRDGARAFSIPFANSHPLSASMSSPRRRGRRGERGVTTRSRGTKCPSCWNNAALEIKRAQGRPGAHRTHGPRATKKHAAEPQVQADHPAFPARWFYGLYVISPVTMLFCHRRFADRIRET